MALAATRVEAYVLESDFSCLARLITGVGNFYALNFILGILIENGQLDLLLQKFSAAADANTAVAETVRGFRMAVVTALKHFNPSDYDAFAMVCVLPHSCCTHFNKICHYPVNCQRSLKRTNKETVFYPPIPSSVTIKIRSY